jgi:CTP synthase (UTP-ammonia lyase)
VLVTAHIAIVGDLDPASRSHAATNAAIQHSAAALKQPVESEWLSTADVATPAGMQRLLEFQGIWIAPGSPYKSLEGALAAIRMARQRRIPLLGTCGGFQHMILEYARNGLGFVDAQHAEYDPNASRLFIYRLPCSLAGRTLNIRLQSGCLAARAYGRTDITEQYYCNFGVNPEYVGTLRSGALQVIGSDDEGEVRVVELAGHPFFVGTLFVPQHRSTPEAPHPLVSAFVEVAGQV